MTSTYQRIDGALQKLLPLACTLFAATLPLLMQANRIAMFGLLLVVLVLSFGRRPTVPGLSPVLLFTYFALTILSSMLFLSAGSLPEAFDEIFPFLVFAFIGWLTWYPETSRLKQAFLNGFLAGNLLSCLLNLLRATYYSSSMVDGNYKFDSSVWGHTPVIESINHVGNYFFSDYYSWFVHPGYAAAYLELCLGIVLVFAIRGTMRRGWAFVLSVVILFNLFLLSSGVTVLSLLVLATWFAVFHLGRRGFVIGLPLVIAVATLMILNPKTVRYFDWQAMQDSARVKSWRSAWVIIQDEWLLGTGVGNAQERLNETYTTLGFKDNALENLNVHNQFLETQMSMGLAGTIVLMAMFINLLIIGIRSRDVILLTFMSSFGIHCLVESMLVRNAGITFFAAATFFLTIAAHRRGSDSASPRDNL